MVRKLFTSESVTEGHPDKICDQISDAVLDAMLAQDPAARCACEVTATTGLISIMGEVTTSAQIDIPAIAREVVRQVGYVGTDVGFDADTCAVITSMDKQSPDIALGVDKSLEAKEGLSDEQIENIGAGDQGMMFGYACDETPELMPLPISLAHKLARQLAKVRKNGTLPYLRPDGKSQVTVEYVDGRPVRIDAVVVSGQHDENVDLADMKRDITEHVIRPVIPAGMMDDATRIYVNPTGRFVLGGPRTDSGLTGRKIIVDTYGGYARHGGGCFSGKDATKVDRSGAYISRYAAKNIVASGLAEKCEIQLAYAIGVAQPISVMVDTFGTGKIADDAISALICKQIDFRPAAVIERLGLRRPIYRQLAAYGHIGRDDLDLSWEKIDLADVLRQEAAAL